MNDTDLLQRANELALQVLKGQEQNRRMMRQLLIATWATFVAAICLLIVLAVETFR
jgi:hypothetical protein